MTSSENKQKASNFTIWALCNPSAKANLDKMAIAYRIAMRKDILDFKTWSGVKEEFKATHRHRITAEFAVPRDQWEFPPANHHD